MEYPLELTPDDNGTYLVTCPDLPEVTTFGDDIADAISHGADAVQEAIAARMDGFTDIPRPSKGEHHARVPLYLDLKIQMFWALAEAGMSRADLVRATGWSRTKVDRLFDPNHENKLAQLEEAFAALDKSVLVELEPA
ncbi:type II toxin-antitoxin system HicB family antitoxin [Paracoccus onubensis]|uniref:Type II toxin-antitoxin system HicB family antitoxin n=1 Tax=Paracoccus onubensis TaxID=1675788 RepID=A0A418T406_9RHOB|nr:type II toxin-antitoxin system HicB family antitoxin [Paracoccus onubensis]RJE87949.1 type II toxin-antitoxin system HicB family antitoxin [Paracoccus onubensis]